VSQPAPVPVPPIPEPGASDADSPILGGGIGDRLYQAAITFFALCIPIVLGLIAIEVVIAAWPALREFGIGFLGSREWDPVNDRYGALPAIYGTLVTSAMALLIATPLALGVAIFLSEFSPPRIRQPFAFLVDLLAAIPSVVYGLWGIKVLVPFLREHVMPFIADTLGLKVLPIFSGPAYGNSMFAAGIILAIMVLPYISAVAREILLAVPRSQREAALALGATRWEMGRGAALREVRHHRRGHSGARTRTR
jgi:phosphate transport system permease protein